MMRTKEILDRPAKIVFALRMFYLIVGLGIIRATMTVIRHADVRSPHSFIIMKSLIYATSLFLIYQMGKGRNWARWMLVVIFAISIPLAILPNFASTFHNPVHTALGFLQLALYIVALVFLFHRNSSGWFGMRKGSKVQ